MQQSASSFAKVKIRSIPIWDSEQGSTMRQGGSLTPVSTPPFLSSFTGHWEPQEPKDRGANPTFRVLDLELLSARAQLRKRERERERESEPNLSTQSHHTERTRDFLVLQKPACQRTAGFCWLVTGKAATLLLGLLFGSTWNYATRQRQSRFNLHGRVGARISSQDLTQVCLSSSQAVEDVLEFCQQLFFCPIVIQGLFQTAAN
ncbi:uncharacterized protein B0H64DRAFT_161103 [Chaetomium fimeti]|uniref:Uncharacterized protein n=1 Tax=Chaetomium fimeti TaxID=1854472 RepID=A0AAE0HGB7_9PEZI|nr:hypothetical protein B0H64DRAFT_161103 [Chaetomium fimeti]